MKRDYLRGNNSGCQCQGCSERYVGCHGECEKYIEWRKKLDAKRKEEQLKTQSMSTVSETAMRKIWRDMRYQRQLKMKRSDHGH